MNRSEAERAQERAAEVEPASVLRPDAEFKGRVHVVAPARLDGSIEGEITAVGCLWIGPTARIRARVSAPEIIIEGSLEGELHATRRVELRPTARVEADVLAPNLSLQEGAVLRGRCNTLRQEERSRTGLKSP